MLAFIKSTRSPAWKLGRLNISNIALQRDTELPLETIQLMRKGRKLDKDVTGKLEKYIANVVIERIKIILPAL